MPSATPPPPRTDTLVESVFILVALCVVQRLIGFGRAVLFCRWLDASQLGLWDMTFSFLLLAAPLVVLAIPGAFGRYLEHYRGRGQLRTLLRRTAITCASLAIAACVAVVLARRPVAELLFGDKSQAPLAALAAACLLAVVGYNFLVEWFTALRRIRLVAVMQLVNSIAFALLGTGLLVAWQCSATSVLAAYAGSCLIAALWAARSLGGVWHSAPPALYPVRHTALWAKLVPFAFWVLVANVLTNLFEVVDRAMIVHFSRQTAVGALGLVGNYHASRLVPMLLVSLAAMLGAMILPHLSHDWEAGRREHVAARLRLFLKLFGFGLYAASVVVLVAAPLLFDVALRGKYPGGQAVLPWTLVYCNWFAMALVAHNYLLCAEKARMSSVALVAGLALNIVLNLELLPRLGLEGAVLSTAAANALSLGLVCLFNRRLGLRLDDGAKLVLVLPMLLCLGPWAAALALVVVAADALWADRLLTSDEKRQLAAGWSDHWNRLVLPTP